MNNTKLADRVLWYDGDISIPSTEISQSIISGIPTQKLFTDEITDEIKQFNKMVGSIEEQIKIKTEIKDFDFGWNIPQEYADLDIEKYIMSAFFKEIKKNNWSNEVITTRFLRVSCELKKFIEYDFLNILRTLIYVINTLRKKDIVWGVGRGSSVSSYILYLIGVHDVDSVAFDLNISDFLR